MNSLESEPSVWVSKPSWFFRRSGSSLNTVHVSPDGKRIALAGGGREIRIWALPALSETLRTKSSNASNDLMFDFEIDPVNCHYRSVMPSPSPQSCPDSSGPVSSSNLQALAKPSDHNLSAEKENVTPLSSHFVESSVKPLADLLRGSGGTPNLSSNNNSVPPVQGTVSQHISISSQTSPLTSTTTSTTSSSDSTASKPIVKKSTEPEIPTPSNGGAVPVSKKKERTKPSSSSSSAPPVDSDDAFSIQIDAFSSGIGNKPDLLASLRAEGDVYTIRFSPDGTTLAAAAANVCLFTFVDPSLSSSSALKPMGGNLCSTDMGSETWRTSAIFRHHQDDVLSLAWCYDSTQLVTGGVDGSVYVYDIKTKAIVHSIPVNQGWVKGLAWDCTGSFIVAQTGSSLNVFRTNRAITGTPWGLVQTSAGTPTVQVAESTGSPVFRIGFSANGAYIAVPSAMFKSQPVVELVLLDRSSDCLGPPHHLKGHQTLAGTTAWSPRLYYTKSCNGSSGDREITTGLAIGSLDGISIWTMDSAQPRVFLKDIFRGKGHVTDICWHPSGEAIYATSSDGTCAIIELSADFLGQPLSDTEYRQQMANLYGETQWGVAGLGSGAIGAGPAGLFASYQLDSLLPEMPLSLAPQLHSSQSPLPPSAFDGSRPATASNTLVPRRIIPTNLPVSPTPSQPGAERTLPPVNVSTALNATSSTSSSLLSPQTPSTIGAGQLPTQQQCEFITTPDGKKKRRIVLNNARTQLTFPASGAGPTSSATFSPVPPTQVLLVNENTSSSSSLGPFPMPSNPVAAAAASLSVPQLQAAPAASATNAAPPAGPAAIRRETAQQLQPLPSTQISSSQPSLRSSVLPVIGPVAMPTCPPPPPSGMSAVGIGAVGSGSTSASTSSLPLRAMSLEMPMVTSLRCILQKPTGSHGTAFAIAEAKIDGSTRDAVIWVTSSGVVRWQVTLPCSSAFSSSVMPFKSGFASSAVASAAAQVSLLGLMGNEANFVAVILGTRASAKHIVELFVLASHSGRLIAPLLVLPGIPCAVAASQGSLLLVLTANGECLVWDVCGLRMGGGPMSSFQETPGVTSGSHLMPIRLRYRCDASGVLSLGNVSQAEISEPAGIAKLTVEGGSAFIYDPNIGCWMSISSDTDNFLTTTSGSTNLASLDALFASALAGSSAATTFSLPTHAFGLEHRMLSALMSGELARFSQYTMAYVRLLIQLEEDSFRSRTQSNAGASSSIPSNLAKIRELCSQLLKLSMHVRVPQTGSSATSSSLGLLSAIAEGPHWKTLSRVVGELALNPVTQRFAEEFQQQMSVLLQNQSSLLRTTSPVNLGGGNQA